jgi:hypothetical protein
MSSRSRIRVPAKKPRSWAVTLIKNRGVLLGFVEAPDEKAAELVAAKTFMLNEWQRKRLLGKCGRPDPLYRAAGRDSPPTATRRRAADGCVVMQGNDADCRYRACRI